MTPIVSPLSEIEDVVALLALDQIEHGLQCAYELAQVAPDDTELQVAGLVHDIGHRLLPGDEAGHGRHGADAVRLLFGSRVADLVELHVPAKRYLVARERSYASSLSPESVHTLALQGGPMRPLEMRGFEATPGAFDAVLLRRADEAAKVRGRRVPSVREWLPVMSVLARRLDCV